MNADRLLKRILFLTFQARKRMAFRKKAAGLLKEAVRNQHMNPCGRDVEKQHLELWKGFDGSKDLRWLHIYSIASGISDPRYISEIVYYNSIEPVLNNRIFSKALTDKNFYDVILPGIRLPDVLLRRIDGVFYTPSFQPLTEEEAFSVLTGSGSFISKPSIDSGGGKMVMKWDTVDGYPVSGKEVLDNAGKVLRTFPASCIFQRPLIQDTFYRAFNETSVNTIRILTYRSVKDEKARILNSVFRVGKSGSLTDNQASGGYACGVDSSGVLTGKAVDKKGKTHNSVNGKELIAGTRLPGFDEVCDISLKVASAFRYSRLLGLDFCISNGVPVLIEINDQNNEINFYQMNGFPLLGDFTEEVINFCRKSERSFVLDFSI